MPSDDTANPRMKTATWISSVGLLCHPWASGRMIGQHSQRNRSRSKDED